MPTAQGKRPISSTALPSAATNARWPSCLKNTPARFMLPEQVRVLPITDRTADYADNITKVRSLGFRAETDRRSEKIGCKIREARTQNPYMLIVGDKEAESNQVSSATAPTAIWARFP